MMNADNVILTGALLTITSTTAASVLPRRVNKSPGPVECVAGELPSFRMLIGQSVLFTGLGMLAPVAPKLAGGLAVAVAATALTYYGIPIINDAFNGDGICKPGSKSNPAVTSPLPRTRTVPPSPTYGGAAPQTRRPDM